MGKFFEALRKAEKSQDRTSAKKDPKKVFNISADEIHALRLDPEPPGHSAASPREFNGRIDPKLVSLIDPQSVIAEQFKMLRAKIFSGKMVYEPLTIVVTSPQAFDGKSTVAANLAIAIAQGINEHVLLVDCDLRRPTQQRLFGLQPGQGLREYLEVGTSIGPYLQKTTVGKLTLLPAGKPPPNPTELLSSEKMGQLIEELKGRYQDRHIIFDTTPAGLGAETNFISAMTDGTLLVVRSGKTGRQTLVEAMGHLHRDKILGVVFNASKEAQRKYQYYYRYYQGSRKK